ncbi:MAG: hypothetical protein VXW65_09340 [Pseudomonadota bacterium]|nr:hypothetical protein [Pseudomonadota bacterium]
MNRLSLVVVGLMASIVTGSALAEQAAQPAAQPVKIELKAFRIDTDAEGKETAVEAKQARPQDLIEYHATYTNTSNRVIRGLAATLPIPADMSFTGTSAPTGAEASTDGENFAAMPLKRQVGDKVVDVPLTEYRALRWKIADLPVSKSVTVRARTRVNGVSQ